MIFLDTNILVALIDVDDQHNARAERDFLTVARRPLFVVPPVLAETYFHLKQPYQREMLQVWLQHKDAHIVSPIERAEAFDHVFGWLNRYAEHIPDWADAYLVITSMLEPRARIWTYDSDFSTKWRRPDGSRIPLAVRK